ncbi:MAG: hypothetical protein AB1485_03055 [Candidatus Thermoplasmatota archaeon]
MINLMNTELIFTTALTITTLAVTIIITANFSNKSTKCLLTKLTNIAENSQKTLAKVASLLHEVHHTSEKLALHSTVDLGLQGVEIAENIETEEDARKLGELVKYSPKLKVAYYKPKKLAG